MTCAALSDIPPGGAPISDFADAEKMRAITRMTGPHRKASLKAEADTSASPAPRLQRRTLRTSGRRYALGLGAHRESARRRRKTRGLRTARAAAGDWSLAPHRDVVGVEDDKQVEQPGHDQKA